MLNLILFGPPGAGKGTQADDLIKKYNLLHLSTGDIIRAEVKANTPLGIKVKECIEAGKLADDDIVIEIINNYIQKHKDINGTIFDGFPRTIAQAQALDAMLKNISEEVSIVVSLEVPDNILIERLLNRGLTSGRADDASQEVIQNRIDVYKEQTSAVKGYYAKQNKVSEVNGVGSIEDIFSRIVSSVDKVL